jgi:hypothetical protein
VGKIPEKYLSQPHRAADHVGFGKFVYVENKVYQALAEQANEKGLTVLQYVTNPALPNY